MFDVESTANSLYTFSLHYTPLFKCTSSCSLCHKTGVFPSLPLFLPLSLRLLLPLIIHEMQSQERERERDFMLKHLKKSTKGGKGGGQRGRRGLKTLLSCRSARWLDGRLERKERTADGEAWVCLFFRPPPSNIIFKSVSIRSGELSSVEEVHCQ